MKPLTFHKQIKLYDQHKLYLIHYLPTSKNNIFDFICKREKLMQFYFNN